MSGVVSACLPSQWNHLNENYVKTVLISLRESLQRARLKWGFCDLGIFDLDRIRLSRGHKDALFSPALQWEAGIVCKRGLLRLAPSFSLLSYPSVCFFTLSPNTFRLHFFPQVPSREIKATSRRGQPPEIEHRQIQGSRTVTTS